MRERAANYVKHESYMVETQDCEDHTFCGIMFDMRIQSRRPVDFVQIEELWVRGGLGGMTVWITRGGFRGKQHDASAWTKVYEKTHRRRYASAATECASAAATGAPPATGASRPRRRR